VSVPEDFGQSWIKSLDCTTSAVKRILWEVAKSRQQVNNEGSSSRDRGSHFRLPPAAPLPGVAGRRAFYIFRDSVAGKWRESN